MSAELLEQRRSRFPLGASLTLTDLESYESGIRLQRSLQQHEPVTWFDAIQAWLVTPRDLVDDVLSAHERFTVNARASFVRAVLGDHMLSRDGEGHRQQRAPYDPSLRLRPVRENYTTLIEDLTDDLLSAIDQEKTVELRGQYANRLAIIVAGRTLGLSFGDIEQVSEIYDTFAERMVDYADPDVEQTSAPTRTLLDTIVRRNLDRIRTQPDASILSSVITADSPDLHHTDDEIVANVRIILFGAIETVTSIILSTTWALLQHPDQLAEIQADPALFSPAVDEALRWISPVGHSERWAAKDTSLGGVEILRGEMVLPSLQAANRDPAFFSEPDVFDIHRANARHHAAFGHGEHHCIGFNLGNLEARIAVRRLFERFPELRLDRELPTEPTGFGFRSPKQLHLILR